MPQSPVTCPVCHTLQDVTATESERDRWDGWRTDTLACGHEVHTVLTWCSECHGLRDVEDVDHEAFGGPDRRDGSGPVYVVTYLSCGHTRERDTGRRDTVLI